MLILLTLIMLIDTTNTMHAYAQPPTKVSGILEDTSAGYLSAIGLHVDGKLYLVQKESKYSNRSFGIINDMKLFPFLDLLSMNIGREVRLKYVQVKNERIVVELYINGLEHINMETAVNDFIGYEKTARAIGFGALAFLIALSGVVWRILHPKKTKRSLDK